MSRNHLGIRALLTGLTVAGMAAAITVTAATSPSLAAGGPPPFEPDPTSAGGLTFFDGSGNIINGGTITDGPFASYVQAVGASRSGDTRATLFGYLPKSGVPTGSWSGEVLSSSTTYPNAAAPAAVNASTSPVVSLTGADTTLATFAADFPNTATDAYQGLYQLRLKTSGPGQTAGTTYFSADIAITGTTWAVVYSGAQVYQPLVPARLLDTRANQSTIDGQFNGTGFVPLGTITELPVGGRGGVPADAAAAVLNVTVTEPEQAGFVTVYPCGADRPTASSVNYAPGQSIPNAVVTKLGTGGKVCIYNSQPTHLVVDVNGFYPAASAYAPLVPGRLLDTRPGFPTIDNQNSGAGVVALGTVTELPVTTRAGVPATASAAVLNVTVTDPVAAGFVTVYPCGSDRPTASNLNYAPGETIANAVITKIGAGGKVCIFNSQDLNLVVDVNGYYPAGSAYAPLVPGRLIDTRPGFATIDGQNSGAGVVAINSVTQLTVTGRAGVPARASAVVLNVTITEPVAAGFATVYPCGSDRPNASNLNFAPGETIANLVVTAVGTDGKVCIFNSQDTQLVVDVTGYYP